jgi:hypothetical protein
VISVRFIRSFLGISIAIIVSIMKKMPKNVLVLMIVVILMSTASFAHDSGDSTTNESFTDRVAYKKPLSQKIIDVGLTGIAVTPFALPAPASLVMNRLMPQFPVQVDEDKAMWRVADVLGSAGLIAILKASQPIDESRLLAYRILKGLTALKIGGVVADLVLPDSLHAKNLGEHYKNHPEQFNAMSDTSKMNFACDSEAPKELREAHESAVKTSATVFTVGAGPSSQAK